LHIPFRESSLTTEIEHCSISAVEPLSSGGICNYHYLRKIREFMLQERQIVPLELPKPASSPGIRIEFGGITVTLLETASAEQLTAVLSALKSC